MRHIIDFNTDWQFYKGVAELSALPEGGEPVSLPHTWNAVDGQDGGNDYFRGTCCYQKKLPRSQLPDFGCCYLELQGANSSADVYLNGRKLAHHDGGYSTWRVNLTDHLEEENTLSVFVDNAPNDRVYPQVADFTFYGGLYRSVRLICVDESHFDLDYYGTPGIKVTPVVEGKNAQVEVEVWVTAPAPGQTVAYTLLAQDGAELAKLEGGDTKVVFPIENVHLWHGRRDPYLYSVKAELVQNGAVIDEVTARFGCRSFEIDPDRGFLLNGEEYPLRGVSRHQDRWGIGNALLPEHHIEDMDLICEVGATTIRLAHYQHDQFFYDLCDERGMVVWAEIPYISQHMATGRDNTISQMTELIVQNYNHPSIIVWGLSNEITMSNADDPDLLENHRILNDLCHRMDATRPTTMACITMCPMDKAIVHIPDVVSYNHYFGWYGGDTSMNGPWFDRFHAKYPQTPIGCSEYGCEALNWHNSDPQQGDYSEEYQAYYHEELIKQFFSRKWLWATHVWNMFDFGADARAEGGENGQNHKGLVTFDRKYKKDAFYAYKAWLSEEKFVHICGKRYVDRVESVTRVTVYSNLPEVELFVNGQSLGTKANPEHFFYFDVPNEGESVLTAVAGGCTDESRIRKVEEMNMDYILREQGAVLNWFDITTVDGFCSLNDKLGVIYSTLRGKLWFAGFVLDLLKRMKGNKGGEKKEKKGGFSMDLSTVKGALNMISGFTVLRVTSMTGMIGVDYTKEELLSLNRKLNRIPKHKD